MIVVFFPFSPPLKFSNYCLSTLTSPPPPPLPPLLPLLPLSSPLLPHHPHLPNGEFSLADCCVFSCSPLLFNFLIIVSRLSRHRLPVPLPPLSPLLPPSSPLLPHRIHHPDLPNGEFFWMIVVCFFLFLPSS